MITLSKLIQNQKIRKNTNKGFEPIEKVTLKGKNYIFGIPFQIVHKDNANIKISFNTSSMDGILPHFKVLDKSSYALTTAYDNVIEVKKKVRASMSKISSVLELMQKDVVKAGFLVKDSGGLNQSLQLELDIDLDTDLITEKEVSERRKNLGVQNFANMEVKELTSILEKQKVKVPKKLENKKGVLIGIVVETMSHLEEGQKTLTKKQREKVNEYVNIYSSL